MTLSLEKLSKVRIAIAIIISLAVLMNPNISQSNYQYSVEDSLKSSIPGYTKNEPQRVQLGVYTRQLKADHKLTKPIDSSDHPASYTQNEVGVLLKYNINN